MNNDAIFCATGRRANSAMPQWPIPAPRLLDVMLPISRDGDSSPIPVFTVQKDANGRYTVTLTITRSSRDAMHTYANPARDTKTHPR
ncbi:MAG TPA: hypothetical protein VKT77_11800 [Chthonomonadaceae bacterium]|nr:hypothetical protein [Chthonomonadaceae bacterium]